MDELANTSVVLNATDSITCQADDVLLTPQRGYHIPPDLPTFVGKTDVNRFIANFEAKVKLITANETQQLTLLKKSLKELAWDRYVLHQDSLQTLTKLKK